MLLSNKQSWYSRIDSFQDTVFNQPEKCMLPYLIELLDAEFMEQRWIEWNLVHIKNGLSITGQRLESHEVQSFQGKIFQQFKGWIQFLDEMKLEIRYQYVDND